MGNNPSSTAKGPERAGAQSHSPAGTLQRERTERRRHHQQHTEHYYGERGGAPSSNAASASAALSTGQGPRQRESLGALSSSAKAQAAPPSLTSTVAHPTHTVHSSTQAQAQAHASATTSSSPAAARAVPIAAPSSQSRRRSATRPAAAAASPSDQPDLSDLSPRSHMMGAEHSQPGEREHKNSDQQHLRRPSPPPEPRLSPASQPVDVPMSNAQARSARPPPLDAGAMFPDTYHLPPSSYSRPPRLPLPIEEEVHTPGSPIASPVDLENEADDIPRRGSVVSSTVDDDEEPDNFEGYSTEHAGPKVPTIIEWRPAKPNDRVYVTGTFTNWERKFRLYKDGPSKHKDALSATLQLPPGTHHIKFIVNGDMVTSEALPTTVDYTNILVNYIEVSLDQIASQGNTEESASTTPVPVPAGPPAPSQPVDIRPRQTASSTAQPVPQNTVPQDIPHHPAPSAAAPAPEQDPRSPSPKSANPNAAPTRPPTTATLVRQPPKNYTSQIPQYLLDLDTYIPSSGSKESDASPAAQAARHRIERANAAAESQPQPPSLPMFLSKSILNGTTPMKDDSSVLIMPNHTVLNHLATTNIKQGVLATSATTRYKRKFLTTIMYKPRSDDGD
ncbi:hypothetical protein AAFC00_003468 [Neodothiora populina]|uniref:Association with the SNF1 complex (ASC) domain-containing protein n=1 Tax=Neodothiora populina TaxID=2781224 RepID=A0ABR3PEI7_9PEZI